MNVYFSGIGGVGLGPLAEIAHDAGHTVMGSDGAEGLMTQHMRQRGVPISIGQDGSFLRKCHAETPLDWFVYTAALPADHPELTLAKELGIRVGKRDEFLAEFIETHNLKMIAIAGTHGKTTTTGMAVWALKQLGVPVSYSIGTTVSFGASGAYEPGSEYFVYECDEYDRNFLHFSPHLSLITSVDYDHPDTYPTEESYRAAFQTYIVQSEHTIAWQRDLSYLHQEVRDDIWSLQPSDVLQLAIPGEHNRRNATLVLKGFEKLNLGKNNEARVAALESFPGTDRRFEKLAENIYSDYGHHPEEIAATLQMARELSDTVVLVYQPHQNWRQHFVKDEYVDQFEVASKVFWLPTYLTREDPSQIVLTPRELTQNITNKDVITYSELKDELWSEIVTLRQTGALILFMGAGTIDAWVREKLAA